jgi:small GTP-binding protein
MVDLWRLKACLVGEAGVGKSSLVRRYVLDQFDDRYIATLGAKALKKELRLALTTGEDVDVVLAIFDIMGVPTFRDLLREAYFTGTQGILAVFDLTRPDTLATLGGWVEAARGVAGRVPVVALGNKLDLVDRTRVAAPLLEAAASRFGRPAFPTSAKSGEGVETAFRALVASMLASAASYQPAAESGLG